MATRSHVPTQFEDGHGERVGHDGIQDDEMLTNPASLRSRCVILAAGFAVIFVAVGIPNTFGVFEDHFQNTLFPHKQPSEVILIGSVSSSLYLIFGAVAGPFADKVGYQISLALGAILMTGGLFLASISHEFYQFFLSQGLMYGLGVTFAYYPAVTISRQYFRPRRHGLSNGIIVSGGAFGGTFLPYIVRVLLTNKGLPQTYRILGYMTAAISLPSVFLLRPIVSSSTRNNSINHHHHHHQRGPSSWLKLSLLSNPRFMILLTAGTIAMTGFLPRYLLLPPSAIAHGISHTYAAWLLGIMNAISIIGRIGIGMFADRHGKVLALSLSFTLCGLGHLLFWLPGVVSNSPRVSSTGSISASPRTTALFTLFVIHSGLLGSGFVSLFPVVVAHLFGPRDLSSKLGLLNSIMGLGVLAGPSACFAIVGGNAHGGLTASGSSGGSSRSVKRKWAEGVVAAGMWMIVGGLGIQVAFWWIERQGRRKMLAGRRDGDDAFVSSSMRQGRRWSGATRASNIGDQDVVEFELQDRWYRGGSGSGVVDRERDRESDRGRLFS